MESNYLKHHETKGHVVSGLQMIQIAKGRAVLASLRSTRLLTRIPASWPRSTAIPALTSWTQ
jgi:hypothetical protein